MPKKDFRRLTVLVAFSACVALAGASIALGAPASRVAGRVLSEPARLGRIVVEGNHLPLPIALEILKTALHSPWSTAWKDRNQIVCRLNTPLGTHIQDRAHLSCETNNDFFQSLNFLQTSMESGGPIPVETSEQPEEVEIDHPGRLRALLAKVPPAGSSYTLKLTSHGRVVSEWVMKKGQLVKAWHLKPNGKR
ncbi:MAG: hypothetical protein ACYCS1_08385 [Gammaproteobacteria bacterium]